MKSLSISYWHTGCVQHHSLSSAAMVALSRELQQLKRRTESNMNQLRTGVMSYLYRYIALHWSLRLYMPSLKHLGFFACGIL